MRARPVRLKFGEFWKQAEEIGYPLCALLFTVDEARRQNGVMSLWWRQVEEWTTDEERAELERLFARVGSVMGEAVRREYERAAGEH